MKEVPKYTYMISWSAVKKSFKTLTNVLIFAQGMIGTVPWGVITYWLVPFLMVTRSMSKETATMVLLILGISSVLGSIVGGFGSE